MLDVRYFNLAHRRGRRRSVEFQGRIHGLDVVRIESLGPGDADEILPHSDLWPGTKALMAGWNRTLHEVAHHGARHDASWLVLLEDDVLLSPRFRRRTIAALQAVPDDCLLVQLGFLSKYTWFAPRPFWKNVVMAGLYVVRGEWRTAARRRGGGDHPLFSRELFSGGQASAVRIETIPTLLELLEPYELVTDDLFRDRADRHPGGFLRSRRQLAIQAPFFFSDLGPERRRQRRANLR